VAHERAARHLRVPREVSQAQRVIDVPMEMGIRRTSRKRKRSKVGLDGRMYRRDDRAGALYPSQLRFQ
jgi:hypothetical protein